MTHGEPHPHGLDRLLREVEGLRALARGLLRNEHDVDDVLQETRLRAWRRPLNSPRPWLARVVRNLALNRLRAGQRRAFHERAASPAPAPPAPDEIASRMEIQRRLAGAVTDLAEPYRTTVFLRFFEDLTPSEIAARLGEPAGTIRSRLKRGLDMLRARLDADHGGDGRACGIALAALAGVRDAEPIALAPVAGRAALALALAGAIAAVFVFASGVGEAPQPHRIEASSAATASTPVDAPSAATGGSTAAGRTIRVLAGQVRAVWGAPIAGATVLLVKTSLGAQHTPNPLSDQAATTDDQGSFRFEAEPDEYRIVAHASGFAWAEIRPGPRTHGILVRLFPSMRFPGVVVDEAGEPVAGARVRIPRFPGEETRSGPDGGFDVEAGPDGVDGLLVEHPRYAPTWAYEKCPPVRVVLGAPHVLSGIVLDGDEKPVAGAEVTVWARARYDVRTDASGRFRIDTFAAGRAGEIDDEGPPRFWIRVDAGERGWRFLDRLVWTPGHELRIILPRVRAWRARVTEAGRPVAMLRIALLAEVGSDTSFPQERPIAVVVTDAEGRYSFLAPERPPIQLKLLGEEYAFAPRSGGVSGDEEEKEVFVVRPPRAVGRVVGPDGEPVVGAAVWIADPTQGDASSVAPSGAMSTDAGGRFRLPVSLWMKKAVVRVAHEGFDVATSEPFEPEAGKEQELEFRLVPWDPSRDISGVVVAEDGTPAGMAHVGALMREPFDRGEAYTAPDGTFRIRGLAEGVHQLGASLGGRRSATTEAALGATLRIVLAKLPPPDPPSIPPPAAPPEEERWTVITGHVLDAEGRAYPYDVGPKILCELVDGPPEHRSPWWNHSVRCDLDGRFEIRVPDDERTYRLQVEGVWPPVFRPVEGVRAGTRDLVLRPEKSGEITGRIRLRDGTVPEWLSISAVRRENAGSDRPKASEWAGEGAGGIDKEGRFRIYGLLGARYVIVAHDNDHAVAFQPAAVGDDVEIILEPGLSLSGTVVGKDGRPQPKALVRVEDAIGMHRQTWTGPDGKFSFTGLAEGSCAVRALADERLLADTDGVRPGTDDLILVLEQYEAEEFYRRQETWTQRK